jgi:hypothetical protein
MHVGSDLSQRMRLLTQVGQSAGHSQLLKYAFNMFLRCRGSCKCAPCGPVAGGLEPELWAAAVDCSVLTASMATQGGRYWTMLDTTPTFMSFCCKMS